MRHSLHIVQNCRMVIGLTHGKRLHTTVCSHELDAHRLSGDFAASPVDEHPSKLLHQRPNSWNRHILACVESGQVEHAFNLYQKMRRECIQADKYTFVALLKACVRLKDVHLGRHVHAEVINTDMVKDSFVSSMLISMFGKCGFPADALDVFNKISDRNVVLWNALLTCYLENKMADETLKCFSQMKAECTSPNTITFTCSLKACGMLQAIEGGQTIHAELVKIGFEKDHLVGNTLVDMYGKCASLAEAEDMFNRLSVQDLVAWNALITSHAEHGGGYLAVSNFDQMQQLGVLIPDCVTYISILKACGIMNMVDKGREVHTTIIKRGLERDLYVGSALVSMFGRCGLHADAQEVFEMLPVRNLVAWNAFITGLTEHELSNEVLIRMEQMQMEGVSPDCLTYICALKACGSIGALEKGQKLRTEIARKGLEREPFMTSSLVGMFVKCGSQVEALGVLDNSLSRDVYSWSAMIAGYVAHGFGDEALKGFELMQVEGVSPDPATYVSALKACAILGSIEKGREICSQISNKGLQKNPCVGNSLVDMFVKCGSLVEAREIFDKLPVHNVVSYSALISGYSEHGPAKETLSCLDLMQLEGLFPDLVIYLCCLKACNRIGDLERGCHLHSDIVNRGLENDPSVGTALVDLFSKAGSLIEAHDIFNKLTDRDVVAWSALIAGYLEQGLAEEALTCFKQMQLEGLRPDPAAYVCSLKACGMIGAIEQGKEIHSQLYKIGLDRDLCVGNTLIDMFGKCGLLAEAQKVFNDLAVRDVVSWTASIAGYAEHGFDKEALSQFVQMQQDGISPNAVTYVCIVKACASMGFIEVGRETHAEIATKGLETDLSIGNTLIDMFCKCGSFMEAREVFEKLPVKDVISWNVLIAGCTDHGLGHEALDTFDRMQQHGVDPDAVTFVCILIACGSTGAVERGCRLRLEISRRKLDKDMFVASSLVDMFGRCGALVEAQEVFDSLPFHSAASWSALIEAFAEHKCGGEALRCFEQMLLEGLSPDAVTFLSALKACSSLKALDTGFEMHTQITKYGFEKEHAVGSTLVAMYGECCSPSEAQKAFDELPVRDVVSWTAMIKGYGQIDKINNALQVFEEMQEQSVRPDAAAFRCLLVTCSRANLVVKGQEFFQMMKEQEIDPSLDHYACITDLFARSGYIKEAERLLQMMQIYPSKETWTILLDACRAHTDVVLGLKCFQHLVQMNIEEASPYVLMAKIYGSTGRWDDANRIESLRRTLGARKKPAIASVQIDRKLYEFAVGSNGSEEITKATKNLCLCLKEVGYTPELGLVLR